jgi:hypothetical protein
MAAVNSTAPIVPIGSHTVPVGNKNMLVNDWVGRTLPYSNWSEVGKILKQVKQLE